MNNFLGLEMQYADYDIESGFFFVVFDDVNSLQCCLASRQDDVDSGFYHIAAIDISNTGYSDGLCGDCNSWAITENGEWSHIEDFLIEQARQIGLDIIA